MKLRTICLIVPLVIACGATDAPRGLAVADTTAYACTPVLVPGPDDEGLIEQFAAGPDGLMAWTTDAATLMVGTAMDQATQVGREGEGPGEFTFIDQIGWSGDTLWATDMMLVRIQYFGPDGGFLDSHPIPAGSGWRRATDGSLMSIGSRAAQAGGWGLLTMSGDSATPTSDTVFHFPGPDPTVIRRPVGEGVSVPMHDPFIATARVGASSDAMHYCGSEPLDGDRVRIRCVDARGQVTADTVLSLAPIPLSDAIWNRVIDFYTRRNPSLRSEIEALFSRPASLPRVTDVGVGTDGSIWLHRSWVGDSPQHWIRLGPDGTIRDTLLITSGSIAQVAGDTLWRRVSDEDGMQRVEKCGVVVGR